MEDIRKLNSEVYVKLDDTFIKSTIQRISITNEYGLMYTIIHNCVTYDFEPHNVFDKIPMIDTTDKKFIIVPVPVYYKGRVEDVREFKVYVIKDIKLSIFRTDFDAVNCFDFESNFIGTIERKLINHDVNIADRSFFKLNPNNYASLQKHFNENIETYKQYIKTGSDKPISERFQYTTDLDDIIKFVNPHINKSFVNVNAKGMNMIYQVQDIGQTYSFSPNHSELIIPEAYGSPPKFITLFDVEWEIDYVFHKMYFGNQLDKEIFPRYMVYTITKMTLTEPLPSKLGKLKRFFFKLRDNDGMEKTL